MQTAIDMISDDPGQVATAVTLFSKCIENAATHFKHIIRDRNHDTRYLAPPPPIGGRRGIVMPMSVCLCVCLFVCLFVCLCVCLSVFSQNFKV